MPNITDKNQSLKMTRLVWFALLMGQFVFLGVIGSGVIDIKASESMPANVLFIANMLFLFIAIPIGLFIRNQIYKANWVGDVVQPQGYLTGNLIFLAICEGVSMLGLVNTMLAGKFGLPILPSVLALAVFVLNFPNGKPMQSSEFKTHSES